MLLKIIDQAAAMTLARRSGDLGCRHEPNIQFSVRRQSIIRIGVP